MFKIINTGYGFLVIHYSLGKWYPIVECSTELEALEYIIEGGEKI